MKILCVTIVGIQKFLYPEPRRLICLICIAFGVTSAYAELQTSEAWKIAFVRGKDIWVANRDGTDQKCIIRNGSSPCWSPDKKQIVFARNGNVWFAQADGSRQRSLTSQWKKEECHRCNFGRNIDISWNFKENSITFSHWEKFRLTRINRNKEFSYILKPGTVVFGSSVFDVALNKTNKKQKVVRFDFYDDETGFNFSDHGHPAWSKSGSILAFVRNGDIWIAKVLEGELEENDPRISWDVTRLAAVASYDAPTWRLSRENYGVTHLSWSPDERYLAYGYRRLQGTGMEEIHLLDTENGENRVLVKEHGFEPSFSPDGQYIAYGRYGFSVWVVSLDGKDNKKLIDDAQEPAW